MNSSFIYFNPQELAKYQQAIHQGQYGQIHRSIQHHPFFQYYLDEIQHIGLGKFYRHFTIVEVEHEKPINEKDSISVILAGHTQLDKIYREIEWKELIWKQNNQVIIHHQGEESIFVGKIQRDIYDQLIQLEKIKNQNQLILFLNSLDYMRDYFKFFKVVEPENIYYDSSRQFKTILSNLTVQNANTRDIIYREHDRSHYIYIIRRGEVEVSTLVTYNKNPTVKEVIEQELYEISAQYNVQIPPQGFQSFNQRLQIEIVAEGQFFGETEYIDKHRRITRATCLSPDSIIYKLNLSRIDFNDKVNRQILYALQNAYNQKKEWINNRVTSFLKTFVQKKCFELLQDKNRSLLNINEQIGNSKKSNPSITDIVVSQIDVPEEKDTTLNLNEIVENSEEFEKLDFMKFAQFQSELHPNTNNLSSLRSAKSRIFKKICGPDFQQNYNLIDQLTDKKNLGRYMNFQGASSGVANYIKQLSGSVRSRFVLDQELNPSKVQQTYRKIRRFQNSVKNTFSLISDLNRQQLMLDDSVDKKSFEQTETFYQYQPNSGVQSPRSTSNTTTNLNQLKMKTAHIITEQILRNHFSELKTKPFTMREERIHSSHPSMDQKQTMNRIHSKEKQRYFLGGPKLPTQQKRVRSVVPQKSNESSKIGPPLALPLVPRIKPFNS